MKKFAECAELAPGSLFNKAIFYIDIFLVYKFILIL
jgi:hypothetical protein